MNNTKIEQKAKVNKMLWNIIKYSLLTIWAIIVLFPFYWMILTSLKSYASYNSEYIPKFLL